MPPKTRCSPRFFPQPGDEDTFVHDGRKDGRYFVVGAGHCGNGVFTNANVANKQTDGFSGCEKRSTKRWTGVGGVEEIWASFCDRLHQEGCHRSLRMPEGWTAPTPVVRNCSAPAPGPEPAPAVDRGERLVDVDVALASAPSLAAPASPFSAPAFGAQTPRPTIKTEGSPLAVRSSVSPSPLRPPPQYNQLGPSGSSFLRKRTALNPDGSGSTSSTSPGSSMMSALNSGSSLSSASSSSGSTRTPTKSTPIRVKSSPQGGYDTDYFYDDDTGGESEPEATQTRFWAVRGMQKMFTDVDEAFDALRANMDRLKYMEVRLSTSLSKLRKFAAS
ncbi:hypothetical protein C8F04DRAFT_1268834 [Mycena alexandri]|uniref:Uncharacterized protein n=1 Tax=Mycena alexandri TaxID=1745969 RepID=A0AAD6WV22_9AGAR|nr:hypothetical protein C8F04DRAFT_1268834 [Mycena alexandri]